MKITVITVVYNDINNIKGLQAAREAGVSAGTIRETLGSSAEALKAAGFTDEALKLAGYTAEELKALGYTVEQLKALGYTAEQLKDAGFTAKALVDAGFTAKQLKRLGVTPKQLKALGYTTEQIGMAGFTADQLEASGFTPEDLVDAGFSAKQLKSLGATAKQLRELGYTKAQIEAAGFTANQLAAAGVGADAGAVRDALSIDSIAGSGRKKDAAKSETKELQALMARQQGSKLDQRYKEKVKQSKSRMLSAANDAVQGWKKVSSQVFIEGSEKEEKEVENEASLSRGLARNPNERAESVDMNQASAAGAGLFIKTGDILFAVLDTSVNTDEPGPILATIVSGKLKGSKIIGSFTLPSNANKMVLTFNTLSMLNSDKTVSISSYAIDPNTARTALAGRVNHHYLMRYGSLFASTFLAGFSSAIQSADTTISIGGTGGTTDTTVQNGINRSLLENALIGLGEVGKAWAETAQQLMNRPTTVELYSGTGMGILFTQDVQLA